MITRIDASAGSGKTYRITRRFLALMRRAPRIHPPPGCDWNRPPGDFALAEILAATFTNRAAAEMKSRIVSSLKTSALRRRAAGNDGGRAERLLTAALRHYGALNVRTIDSLLNALVRLSALELGLPPDFEPAFGPEEYFTPLYDGLMRDLAPGPQSAAEPSLKMQGAETQNFGAPESAPQKAQSHGLSGFQSGSPHTSGSPEPLFTATDAAGLHKALEDACRARLFTVQTSGFHLRGSLHRALHELFLRALAGNPLPVVDPAFVFESVGLQKAALDQALTLLSTRVTAEKLVPSKNFSNFLNKCAALELFALIDSVYASKDELGPCLLKASPVPSPQAEKAYADFREVYARRAALLPLLKEAAGFAPLTLLCQELLQRAFAFWRRERILPGPLVPHLAARLLSGEYGVSDALCRLGTRLSHILLDEFQDTSREQWAAVAPLALECLSRGGSLGYVGDVKQAIYSWRGGDAHLFAEVVRDPELRAVSPAKLRKLPYNRRSCAEIVHFNNAAFSILGEKAGAEAVLAAMLPEHTPPEYLQRATAEAVNVFTAAAQALPPGTPNSSGTPATAPIGKVSLYGVRGPSSEAVDASVAERLHRLLAEDLLPRRPLGDIALLTRSRGEIADLAAMLAGWGVPVVTEESFLPAEHPLVAAIINLLAFLQYPADDAAFWGCLTLLRDADPTALREAVCGRMLRRSGPRPPLYRLFAEAEPERWKALFDPLLRRAGLMSAYDLIMEAVHRFNLPLDGAAHGPFLRRLLETAHLAEGRGCSSPPAFLDFWRERCLEDKLPLPEGMDAVRLMTIHAAKGLEFPVVILPSLHRGKDNSPEPAVFEHRGELLPTRALPELPELFYPARITSTLEHLNLLYVAWTRPREELHAFITRPVRNCGPLGKGLETLVPLLQQRAPETFTLEELPESTGRELGLLMPLPPAAATVATAAAPGPETEAAGIVEPMSRLPRLKIYRSVLQRPTFTPERRGTLAHLCLEHLHLSGPGHEEADVDRAVAHALRLFPLPLEHPEEAAQSMRESLLWFARLACAAEPADRFEAVAANATEAFHAAPLAGGATLAGTPAPTAPFNLAELIASGLREQGLIDESGRRLRADLLVEQEHQVVVLDYKTGRPEPEHLEQIRAYMRLAGAALGKPSRGLLIYLDERRVLEVTP